VTPNGHSITKVQFYNGSTLLGEDTSAPYAFGWTGAAAGSYTLAARAVYDAGSTVTTAPINLSVANPLPTIALTAPANGAAFTAPATIGLSASVTPNGHTITKVQFYNGATLLGEDTTAPYAFNWSSVAAGSYTLSARVVYDAGNTVSSVAANISVANSVAPTIALTAPANGASFTAPATISLAASVTPNGHSITKVQFYNGTALLGEDTTAPYAFDWTSVAAGSYTLTARAVYDAGSTVASSPITTTVQNISAIPDQANTTVINIPGSGMSSLYPSKITVAGLPTNPTKITVTLTGISHTYPDDLDILLVGPGGQKVMLMSDSGGSSDINNVTLTFDDAAASKLADSTAIISGTFKPTDFATGDNFPAPAPAGPYGTTLSAFNGLDPNGTWSLYVFDDAASDSGSIAGGWSLKLAY
jgi:subtilisin-like proprotein convertase family protein